MSKLSPLQRKELERKVSQTQINDELAVRFGQLDYRLYFEYITGEKWQSYQHEWHEARMNNDRTEIKAPRKHGKSTDVLTWVAWMIGRSAHMIGWRGPIATLILGSNETEATKKSLLVRSILENPKHQEIFPDCIPDNRNWGNTSFSIKGADPLFPTCLGVGITSLRAGPGAHIIVPDDVCDLMNSYYSPAGRAKVKGQWYTVAEPMLLPGGKIVYIYTPYHYDDLSAEIQKNPKWKHIDNSIPSDLTPLWPDRYPREWLEDKRATIGSIAFARGFHCTPASSEDMPLRFEWLMTYHSLPTRSDGSPAHWNYFLGLDPAVTAKASADYWAFVIIAKSPTFPGFYVIECVRDHFTKREALETAAELASKYRIIAERNEATAAQDWLTEDLREVMPTVHIDPVKPQRDKMSRLMEHQALFENRHVHFQAVTLGDNVTFLNGQADLVQETFGFPLEAHDDTMDGLLMAIDCAKEWGDQSPAADPSKESELEGRPEVMNIFDGDGGGF